MLDRSAFSEAEIFASTLYISRQNCKFEKRSVTRKRPKTRKKSTFCQNHTIITYFKKRELLLCVLLKVNHQVHASVMKIMKMCTMEIQKIPVPPFALKHRFNLNISFFIPSHLFFCHFHKLLSSLFVVAMRLGYNRLPSNTHCTLCKAIEKTTKMSNEQKKKKQHRELVQTKFSSNYNAIFERMKKMCSAPSRSRLTSFFSQQFFFFHLLPRKEATTHREKVCGEVLHENGSKFVASTCEQKIPESRGKRQKAEIKKRSEKRRNESREKWVLK